MRLTASAVVSLALLAAACSPASDTEAASGEAPEGAQLAERDADAGSAPGSAAKQAQDGQTGDDAQSEARALADRLMTALGYDVMTTSIPDVFAEASARSLTSCTPATPTGDVRELTRVMREELTSVMPRYYDAIRDSYVRRLTVEELEALANFYETPAGRRIAEKAAELTYDQFNAQAVIDAAALRAYERLGWCDNAL